MNLVFVNSFEKRIEVDRILSAQVSIAEQYGVWHVLWNEPDKEGSSVQEVWFEGDKWQEMLAVFRSKLSEKASEGYLPLIDGYADGSADATGRLAFTRMLQFYSEQHANEDLLLQLRQWRRDTAAREKKPPYLIALNRMLSMMACFIPHTPQELLCIPGFGESKNDAYGKAILELTGKFQQTGVFPLDWVVEKVDMYEFKLWQHKQRELKQKADLEKKEAKRKLLELVEGGERLDGIAQTLKLQRREVVLWMEELEAEGYDFDAWIDVELERIPETDRSKALVAMKQEGDRYLKPILKKMYNEEELKDKEVDRIYEWLRLMRLRMRKEKAMPAKAG